MQIYGALAKLSDIKLDINNDSLYIEANINTIDNKTLSSAALFTPKDNVDYKKFDILNFADSDRDYQFYFASEGSLNTNERKNFLHKIQNADIKDLDKLEAHIQIGYLGYIAMHEINNLKIDLNKAIDNVALIKQEQELAKYLDKQEQSFVLLSVFLDKLRLNYEKYKEFQKNEAENEFLENFKKEPLEMVLNSQLVSKKDTET